MFWVDFKPQESFSQWNTAVTSVNRMVSDFPGRFQQLPAGSRAGFCSFQPLRCRHKEPESASSYGTEQQMGPSDGVLSARPSDRSVGDVLAFLVPFAMLFLVQARSRPQGPGGEADDRPTLMLSEMNLQGVDVILGTLLGGLVPTMLAVRRLRGASLLASRCSWASTWKAA